MRYIFIILILIIPWTVGAYTNEETTKAVINSLETEPEQWRHDAYRIYYFKGDNIKKATEENKSYWDTYSDCHIWIANGPGSIEIKKPSRVEFTEKQQIKIWKMYQRWANKAVADKFEIFIKSKTLENIKSKPEQTINKSPKLLSNVGEEKATPVEELSNVKTFTYSMLIIAIIFILAMVILGISKKRNLRRHSSAR